LAVVGPSHSTAPHIDWGDEELLEAEEPQVGAT
jgi:hypothetical protein